jgi:hypothetical protein
MTNTSTTISYSTYLGSNWNDLGTGLAVNPSTGEAYVVGSTTGSNFPTTVGAYQGSLGGSAGVATNAFVTKLNASGSGLVFSTYLGGTSISVATGVAVDSSGNAYVSGYTNSSNFPTSSGAYLTSLSAVSAAVGGFVAKFSSSGSLSYSTLYAGNNTTFGMGVAVNSATGNAYLVGYTASTNLTTTSSAYQSSYGGGSNDAFIAEFNAGGSSLLYGSYLGGGGADIASGVALDSSGNAYVTGYESGYGFPATACLCQGIVYDGQQRSYVVKFGVVTSTNSLTSTLSYATYFGYGSNANAIAVDSYGNAYVGGFVYPYGSIPTTSVDALATSSGGGYDGYVTVLASDGSRLLYSSYLGGSGDERVAAVALDSAANIYLAGYTSSLDFPVTALSYQPQSRLGNDVFAVEFSAITQEVAFSTQAGGNVAPNVALSPQPVVVVKNLDGSTAITYTGPVTLSIEPGTGQAGASIGGNAVVNAVSGVATFTNTTVSLAGVGYVLQASASLAGAVCSSSAITITGNVLGVNAGTPQSAYINQSFATPLSVYVHNTSGSAVSGVVVTFVAYTSGPGASFSGAGPVVTATTNSSGIATAPSFFANGTSGTYTVTATAPNVSGIANFALTNTAIAVGSQPTLVLTPIAAGPNPISSTQVLSATLLDRFNQPIPSATVTFTVSGANGGTYTANTNASGVAVITYTGTITGTDTVQATATVNSTNLFSNLATIYWVNQVANVTIGTITGRFFTNNGSTSFTKTPSDIPVFTQTFPSLLFDPPPTTVPNSPYDWSTLPFTDITTDSSGNYTGYVVAQGNGYVAGQGVLWGGTGSARLSSRFDGSVCGKTSRHAYFSSF